MQNYPQYSSKQKWIHWLTLMLIVCTYLLVFLKVTLSPYLGGMFNIYLFHKSFGVLIFGITLWRFIVIKQDGVPDVLPKSQKRQRILSKSVQGFIYILLIIVPLSGYLMSSHPLNFFGVISIPAIDMPNKAYQLFHQAHQVSAYLLIALLIVHIAGALFHYFWIKDKVLQSMLKCD
ncbi:MULTISPECIES: cytochrome b [unclassified Gilliamella]|uniref:cytochrome b n=1 Tax=unclassified Gilliamella TaxID=2685620 RepID=UPI00130CD5F8|nr:MULTISPECIES: cytochrome b [unclassified Gilliamella]MWP49382.1 hypothetical protein [Gilliamella sp. Lep-s35]MWP69006.1 hypothetical protein [Gilliamella sp. Lep-s5]MWP77373.1 hypothetical protein [Gilliamella sp. Lep-s21]